MKEKRVHRKKVLEDHNYITDKRYYDLVLKGSSNEYFGES